MEEELKKRKLEKTKEDEFAEMKEHIMSSAQITTKLSDHKEMIEEAYKALDIKDQEIAKLEEKVKIMEESFGMIMQSFQTQLVEMQKEIKELKCGNMKQEGDTAPQKVTEPVKDPIGKREHPWVSPRTKKSDKEINKTTSKIKEVLLKQTPPIQQSTKGNAQISYLQKLKENIRTTTDPVSLLLKKEQTHSDGIIVSWTIEMRLNDKGQYLPRQSMLAVIKRITDTKPLNISMITSSSAQILFKEEDLPSFQKLLSSKMIQVVDTKKDNFHQGDIARLAHLYLSGYHKDLAYAAIQNLPVPIITQILTKAATLVKQRFPNVLTQKRWNFIIKKDILVFQPPQEGMDVSSTNHKG
jgi:hypothetical protein